MFADSGAPLPPGVRHGAARGRSPRRSSARSSATAPRSTPRRSAARRRTARRRRPGLAAAVSKRFGSSIARAVEQGRPSSASVRRGMTVETRPRGVALLVASPARALVASRCSRAGRSRCSPTSTGSSARTPARRRSPRRSTTWWRSSRRSRSCSRRARCRGRARGCVRSGGVPAWYFLGGFGGAALVLVSAVAAPEVGVALLTVALVCGSTGGSLPVDAAGLGPVGPAADHAAARRRRAARHQRDRDQRARRAR